MKRILIIFLFLTVYAFAMAQLHSERGYIVKGKSVYYSSTVYYPTGVALSKKAIRARQKRDRREKGFLVSFADAKTFKNLGKGYGVDCNNVFYRGDIIEGADPATFTAAEYRVEFLFKGYMQDFYYKDKNHVYYWGKILEGADATTFKYATSKYALDKNSVFTGGVALDIAPDEYTVIGDYYIVGNENVYWDGKLLAGVKPDSFRLLKDGYATDGDIIIFEGKPMDADASTFRKLFSDERAFGNSFQYSFYTDKYGIYHRGEPAEVTFLGENYFVYDGMVFYRAGQIRHACADSFVSLNDYWGKDKRRVYYKGESVSADVDSFIPLLLYNTFLSC